LLRRELCRPEKELKTEEEEEEEGFEEEAYHVDHSADGQDELRNTSIDFQIVQAAECYGQCCSTKKECLPSRRKLRLP